MTLSSDDERAADVNGLKSAHVAERFFSLLSQKDLESWGHLWAERGRILVPYPPEGFPPTIEGRDAIIAAFRDLFAHFATFDARISTILPAAESDVVCVQYEPHATLLTGVEYTNINVAVFTFRDGLITTYRDYFDPRRFKVVVDALAADRASNNGPA